MKKSVFFTITALLFLSSPSLQAKKALSEAEIASRLAKGEGGLIVRQLTYVRKKDFSSGDKEYKNLEDYLSDAATLEKNSGKTEAFFLTPESPEFEIGIKLDNKRGHILILGKPGDYTLTRLMHKDYLSRRIFGKTTIEAGKLKYIGDALIIVKENKSLFDAREVHLGYDYKPQEAQESLRQWYPSQQTLSERLHFKDMP